MRPVWNALSGILFLLQISNIRDTLLVNFAVNEQHDHSTRHWPDQWPVSGWILEILLLCSTLRWTSASWICLSPWKSSPSQSPILWARVPWWRFDHIIQTNTRSTLLKCHRLIRFYTEDCILCGYKNSTTWRTTGLIVNANIWPCLMLNNMSFIGPFITLILGKCNEQIERQITDNAAVTAQP